MSFPLASFSSIHRRHNDERPTVWMLRAPPNFLPARKLKTNIGHGAIAAHTMTFTMLRVTSIVSEFNS